MADERFGGGFGVRGLDEVAIRCRDLPATARFYGEILGLERLAGRDGIAVFRIAEGFGGQDVVLALSPAGPEEPGAPAHLALRVTAHDQARAADWFRRLGLSCRYADLPGTGRRGLFAADPEGNTVALVAATGGGPEHGG
ncbi:MAG: VOC family protein [Paracoccaceae bacterium]